MLADSTPVARIRVVVHTLGSVGPNSSDNHWSIYLIHQNGISSTRANMRADYGDQTGLLEWTRLGYSQSTSAIQFWDFDVMAELNAVHFASLIYNLQRYMMSGGGSGCQWWV